MLPDDIKQLAIPVLAHRLIPTAEARIGRREPQQIITDLLERVPISLAGGARRS